MVRANNARQARDVDRMILACFVLGLSTRKVQAAALLPVLGRPLSPATVSAVAKQLDQRRRGRLVAIERCSGPISRSADRSRCALDVDERRVRRLRLNALTVAGTS